MRIAMIGQKGVPATFGGVEHHVEQLGQRLVARGHDVCVYTRPSYSPNSAVEHLGMRLRSMPSLATKHFDAITHSVLSSLDTRFADFDIVHYHAVGPCLTAPLARRGGRKLVATVHGQDWRRAKWGPVAKWALRNGESAALRVPDATISVSRTLAQTYAEAGHRHVRYIPNGVVVSDDHAPGFLDQLGVKPGEYLLFAGRLVPEKGAHYLIEAWNRLGRPRPLVVVGDSSFSDDYVDKLRADGENVIFTGYLQGAELGTVFRNAGLFVMPSDLEGLPLVLLESLAHGTPVLASDIAPNVEVLGDQGAYFRAGDVSHLADRLGECIGRLESMKLHAETLSMRVRHEYDWDAVAEQTERLYASVVNAPARAACPPARSGI